MNALDITLIAIAIYHGALLLYAVNRVDHLQQENNELKKASKEPQQRKEDETP